MSWSLRRQIIIFLLVTGFFALTGFILWFIYHPRPSCEDGVKNQNELDVDCGGLCSAVCSAEVSAPIIWWQQAFPIKDQTYDLAALIENKLDQFGIARLDYVFRAYGPGQVLLKSVSGQTFVNPNEKTLVYVPNVVFSELTPVRVSIEFATSTLWQRQAESGAARLSTSEGYFANEPFPQVRTTITNNSLETYREIEVFVVLSDSERNVFAVSKTFVDRLDPSAGKDIFFSWPRSFDLPPDFNAVIDFYYRVNTLNPLDL